MRASPIPPKLAAEFLTYIIRQELSVQVEEHMVRQLIERRWHMIAPFAHIIHDDYVEREKVANGEVGP